ncbi:MAG: hypothetical protein ACJAZ6_002297 [Oleispira sp.]|jgi:hypothetical protein
MISYIIIAPSATINKASRMRILKTRWFHKWAKKEKLTDSALRKAVSEWNKA